MTVEPDQAKFAAAVAMIGRMGGKEFEIRYCDGHDGELLDPVVWIARARWEVAAYADDEGVHEVEPRSVWQATGAMDAWRAVFRLLESVMDGGHCTHCGKPTAVDESPPDDLLASLDEVVCWYRFDPELRTFRRQCEGVA
jgi:hypothetical protein